MNTDFQTLMKTYQSVPMGNKKTLEGYDESALFVMQRYNAMAIAKQYIRSVWEGTQKLYYANDWEWIVSGEDINRPIRFTTGRDFIKTLTDVYMQNPPDWILEPGSDEDEHLAIAKKAYLDDWRDSIHEKTVRRQVIEDMFFFGAGLRYVSYYDIHKNIDGKEVCLFNDVASDRIDPRHFFVDESANKLHDNLRLHGARDCIIRQTMPYSTYLEKAKQYGFAIDGVIPENWFATLGLDYIATNSRELLEKGPIQEVKLYEYMNQQEDLYIIVANNKTVYKDSLKKCKGTSRLPVVAYVYEPRNDSFWGNTFLQILAPHIYYKDTVINLHKLNLQLSLQPVLAVSSDFGYNKKLHQVGPGQVWQATGPLNGKIGDNLQPIVVGNPNAEASNTLQMINSEMAIASRTDVMNLQMDQTKTATGVLAQNRSQAAHNERIESINEIEAEAVLGELVQEIMKSFMKEKKHDEVHGGKRKRVPIKGYVAVKNDTQSPEFMSKSGNNDYFELTQEMIDVDTTLKVKDARTELAKGVEKMGRILQAVPLIGNLAQLAMSPTVDNTIDVAGIIEQVVEAVGMDPDRSIKSEDADYADEFEMVKEEILLGNEVGIPEECRDDSIARLRFLRQLDKQYKFKGNQKTAWQHHLELTLANISKDHYTEYLEVKKQKKVAKERTDKLFEEAAHKIGQGGTANTPGGAAPGVPTQNIPQPSAGLLGELPGAVGGGMARQLQ